MVNLKFADTHNMVAFLSKPAKSDGFEQIVDFLNANLIMYALTINPTIYISCIEQFGSTVKAKTVNGEVQLHALVDGKKIIITESIVRRDLQLEDDEGVDCLPNATIFKQLAIMGKPKRKDTQIPQSSGHTKHVVDEAIHKERGDSLVRVDTTASSLEAEQDNGNIAKTQSKETPNESSSLRITSCGSPRCQETMGDTIAQTRFENVSKLSNDRKRVLDLEQTKTTQAEEIVSLKRRVKKLEQKKRSRKKRSRTHGLKRLHKVGMSRRVVSSGDEESLGEDASKQGRRINAIDADEDITLVNVQDDADKEMYDVGTVTGDEVFAEQEVTTKDVNLTSDEGTLAQALAALKSVKPKVKRDVIDEPNVPVNVVSASTKVSVATTTTATIPTLRKGIVIIELGTPTIMRSSQQPSQAEVQDKGKGKMIELEPVKKMSKKDQLRSDEEEAKRLQAEFDKDERLAREKDEANVALTEEWDDIQAKIEAGHELAQRLQAEEQEELSLEEKAKLFQQLLEQRRKHFAAKSAKEKRNKPPTQTQQRKIMCTNLKNMEGKKLKDLKNKSFDSIKKLFDRAFKRVNTFVDFRTDLVEGSSKRAGEELEQESTKKQKMDEDKDTTELKSLMEVIPNEEEVAIDAVPLATKPPTIFKDVLSLSQLLKSVDKEDLVELYKLVKAKHGSTRPVEDMDLLLWGDLKIMFKPHVENEIWKLQQRYKVLSWKLFDSCGMHCLSLQSGMIYMLVEKRYPLTPPTIKDMLNKKLQYKVNAAEGVNAASEEVSTAELVSTAYLKEFDLLKWDQHMINQNVQEMQYSEQTHVDDFEDNEIHSGSNIIPYSQYLQETQDAVIQDTNPSAPNDLLVLSLVEQMTDHVAHVDKENQTNKMVNESLTTELERYKERIATFEQILNGDLNQREKLIDSQMDDLIHDRNAKLVAFQQEIDTLKETLSNNWIQPTLYDGSVIAKEHIVISVIDDEETLILEEESRSKMLDKQNDPISIENKIKISLIDSSKLNKIKEDFGKRFVTQKELSAEQAFWLKHSSLSEIPITSHTPVRIEALSELSKSCVDNCNKCLELENRLFKNKDFIKKEVYDKLVKSYSSLEKHCISLELATQLNQEIFRRENSGENLNTPTFNQLFEINELKAQSQEKDTVIRKLKEGIKSLRGKNSVENVKKDIDEIETINIELEHKLKNELRKLKGKNIVNTSVSEPNATVAPGIFKLDIEALSPRLKNNRDAHEACHSSPTPSGKVVVVTLKNKYKRVRFAKPITSSNNIPKQTDSLKTKDSNKPLLTSTRVKLTTSASGSKPSGNTKNNRITRKPHSN
ncbi:hypothetical protein Tco_0731700 [Tanacetum coccineum]